MMKIAMSLHKKVTAITLIAMSAAFSGDGGRKTLPRPDGPRRPEHLNPPSG
jgi:hypothetical protein